MSLRRASSSAVLPLKPSRASRRSGSCKGEDSSARSRASRRLASNSPRIVSLDKRSPRWRSPPSEADGPGSGWTSSGARTPPHQQRIEDPRARGIKLAPELSLVPSLHEPLTQRIITPYLSAWNELAESTALDSTWVVHSTDEPAGKLVAQARARTQNSSSRSPAALIELSSSNRLLGKEFGGIFLSRRAARRSYVPPFARIHHVNDKISSSQ